MKTVSLVEILNSLRDLVHHLQSSLSGQTVRVVVYHVLEATSGAQLHNKDVCFRVIFFFIVLDILYNVGLNTDGQ